MKSRANKDKISFFVDKMSLTLILLHFSFLNSKNGLDKTQSCFSVSAGI